MTYDDGEIIEVIPVCTSAVVDGFESCKAQGGLRPSFLRRVTFTCGRSYTPQMGERMHAGYQPKPDDVFHAVGYTTRDISDNTHFHLHRISDRVRMENENLWRQLGPLVHAMQSGKVKREFVEVLSVDPFLGNYEMPYTGPHKEMFLSSDAAFRLCREYGIRHPAVIEKVKRADIPGNHGITLRAVHYSRI